MIRVNFHLTEMQLRLLRHESKRTGLTVAELIRRAVDAAMISEAKRKAKEDMP